MAILGNSTAGSSYVSGAAAGRMLCSKFTLASAGTLNELHGWLAFGTAGNTIRIVIYKDVDGLATPRPSSSCNKSRADGVRRASVGRLLTSPPVRSKS